MNRLFYFKIATGYNNPLLFITAKVLSKELKELDINKLVIRKVADASPVTIECPVSSYYKSLKSMVDEMIRWGKNHWEKIARGG